MFEEFDKAFDEEEFIAGKASRLNIVEPTHKTTVSVVP